MAEMLGTSSGALRVASVRVVDLNRGTRETRAIEQARDAACVVEVLARLNRASFFQIALVPFVWRARFGCGLLFVFYSRPV